MEVEKSSTEEVVMPTAEEKAAAIAKKKEDEAAVAVEEKSRVDGFMPELDALCRKWNVTLMADVRFIGVGSNVSPTINIGVQAIKK